MTSNRKVSALLNRVSNETLESQQSFGFPRRPATMRSAVAKGGRFGLLALTLLTLAGCSAHMVTVAPPTTPPTAPPTTPPTTPKAKFQVFDATLYKAKPNLGQFGLTPLNVEYPGVLWPKAANMDNVPAAAVVEKLAAGVSQSTGLAVVDIEQWAVTGDPVTVADSIGKYQQTLQMFQQAAPSLHFGYYAIAPIRDYWNVMAGPQSAGYLAWQKENDAVAPIAQQADALFPSLYTFYTDQVGWKKYAIANIAEARRIAPGKPVYVFLWPQYDASTGAQGGEYLPDDYWKMELETAKQYADGVVIWGGWTETWDDNASWWLETQQFMTEVGAKQASATDTSTTGN
jgi:hypothetical protein